MASEDKLELYKRIVDEYFVNSFQHRDAVRTVRNLPPDTPVKTLDTYWLRLRENEAILPYIANKHFEARHELKISHQDILRILKNWIDADFTVAMCMTESEIKELPLSIRKLIKGWKTQDTEFEGGTKTVFEIFWVDKSKAIEMVNKHIGFYEKGSGDNTVEVVITDNRQP